MPDETPPAEPTTEKKVESERDSFLKKAKDQIGRAGKAVFEGAMKAAAIQYEAAGGGTVPRMLDYRLKGTSEVPADITKPTPKDTLQRLPPQIAVPTLTLNFTRIVTGLGPEVDRVLQKSQGEVVRAVQQTYDVLKDRVYTTQKSLTILDKNVRVVDTRSKKFEQTASQTLQTLEDQLRRLSSKTQDYEQKFQKMERVDRDTTAVSKKDDDSLLEDWLKFKATDWLLKALPAMLPRILGLGTVGAIGTALWYAEQQRQAAGGQGPWVAGSRFEDQRGARRIVGGVLDWIEKPYSKEEQEKIRREKEHPTGLHGEPQEKPGAVSRGAASQWESFSSYLPEQKKSEGRKRLEEWQAKNPGKTPPYEMIAGAAIMAGVGGGPTIAPTTSPPELDFEKMQKEIGISRTEVRLTGKETILLQGSRETSIIAPRITIEAQEIIFKGKVTGLPKAPAPKPEAKPPGMAPHGIAPHSGRPAVSGELGRYMQAREQYGPEGRPGVAPIGTGAPGDVGAQPPPELTREQSAFFGPGASGIPETPGTFGLTGNVVGALSSGVSALGGRIGSWFGGGEPAGGGYKVDSGLMAAPGAPAAGRGRVPEPAALTQTPREQELLKKFEAEGKLSAVEATELGWDKKPPPGVLKSVVPGAAAAAAGAPTEIPAVGAPGQIPAVGSPGAPAAGRGRVTGLPETAAPAATPSSTPAFEYKKGETYRPPEIQAVRPSAGHALSPGAVMSSQYKTTETASEVQAGIVRLANKMGVEPNDLATIMSYESAGSMDPYRKGPTTKWGTHRGLIQMGETQQKQYGINLDPARGPVSSIDEQFVAIEKYFDKSGFSQWMKDNPHADQNAKRLAVYATVNAGDPYKVNVSDVGAGGAPGTVQQKVEMMFADKGRYAHYPQAKKFMEGSFQEEFPEAGAVTPGPTVARAQQLEAGESVARAAPDIAKNVAGAKGAYSFPVTGDISAGRTSEFGYGRGRLHAGVDIYGRSAEDTKKTMVGPEAAEAKVYAAAAGTVVSSRTASGYGYIVDIKDSEGLVHRYAHIAPPTGPDGKPLRVGAKVERGQPISYITGAGTDFNRAVQSQFGGDAVAAAKHFDEKGWGGMNKPHLHYEVRTKENAFRGDSVVDPAKIYGETMTREGKTLPMFAGMSPGQTPETQPAVALRTGAPPAGPKMEAMDWLGKPKTEAPSEVAKAAPPAALDQEKMMKELGVEKAPPKPTASVGSFLVPPAAAADNPPSTLAPFKPEKQPPMPGGPIKPSTQEQVSPASAAEIRKAKGAYPGAQPAPAKLSAEPSPLKIESVTTPSKVTPVEKKLDPATPKAGPVAPKREREKSNPQSGAAAHQGKTAPTRVKEDRRSPSEGKGATGGQRDTGGGGGGTSPDHCHFCDP